jgi:cytochrome c2
MSLKSWHALGLTVALLATPCQGQTLAEAIKSGDLTTVENLLNEGADLDKLGVKSPLYIAAERGHGDIVKLLLDQGANANGVTRFGSPLHIAARKNLTDIVEILLAADADPNIVGNEYNTSPIHEAAYTGAVESAALLLAIGADVNKRTSNDHPPIHFAATKGREEMVELLLEYGAEGHPVEPLKTGELAQADPADGKIRIHECQRCHVTSPEEPISGAAPGPNLWNVVGRSIASMPNYQYSDAMIAHEGTWTFEALNRFIADPTGHVPGTAMYLGGEPDRETRISLIAYLASLSDNPMPLE